MKKKILISTILLVSITTIVLVNNYKNEKSLSNISSEESITYVISAYNDYQYNDSEILYDKSDVVIIGNYKNDVKTIASENGDPMTLSTFNIEKVIKGDIRKDSIDIYYIGGTITLDEYVKTQTKEQLVKKGISNIKPEDMKKQFVIYKNNDIKINFSNNGDKYMLFLKFNEKLNNYCLMSNGYGALKTNNKNQIYNYETQNYEDVNFYKN
ncbi:MAG: hypothetical protein ACM3O4_05710 [Ignavibacteriales bacterium]